MLYFANPCGPEVVAAMTAGLIGLIETPMQGSRGRIEAAHAGGVTWVADNGCFGKGYPGDDAWLNWLARNAHRVPTCMFATAPDVVGDAEATLARSVPWLRPIRDLGYPAALVAQDGLEELTVPWDAFDVLFLGGSTEWKLGPHAAALTAEAIARGKPVHMGRVNSFKRFAYARRIGCASVDGTYLTFGPDKNLPRLLRWINTPGDILPRLPRILQPALF